jgi:hypothetical protein
MDATPLYRPGRSRGYLRPPLLRSTVLQRLPNPRRPRSANLSEDSPAGRHPKGAEVYTQPKTCKGRGVTSKLTWVVLFVKMGSVCLIHTTVLNHEWLIRNT